ncbi:MAG: GNAT family N-acetyltransferase [Fimbriimonadaceae bacterium]|nr:GNAT family N-acetyltransferase [Fimbriimonadaceae bacterium]
MEIRPAREGEQVDLTDLAFRSARQCWGYSDEFMAWEPEAIAVSPGMIAGTTVRVLVEEGRFLGFYVLSGEPPELELSRMFVEPDALGAGLGRQLWSHAVDTAARLGASSLVLDADPNAEAFYLHMGAVTVSEHDWEPPMMPGWRLRKMRYGLT